MDDLQHGARKLIVLRALYTIGESRWADDFREATTAESYATLEQVMREALKAGGPDQPHWASAVAHAIVECQLLPHAQPATATPATTEGSV